MMQARLMQIDNVGEGGRGEGTTDESDAIDDNADEGGGGEGDACKVNAESEYAGEIVADNVSVGDGG
ncbi:unnamed protein product [Linum trigynum]|uniref:Uncharacterized protein n=1 Tax=Linum trigynum TaxID=586398 RepID=A0AAV2GIM1_9ROSI